MSEGRGITLCIIQQRISLVFLNKRLKVSFLHGHLKLLNRFKVKIIDNYFSFIGG